ncbi:MAG: plasmid recombination protein, partial [Deltaproteobacteria bacterium]|nr:plasmid recombination protein [Deltaproteobacteria bacterium]
MAWYAVLNIFKLKNWQAVVACFHHNHRLLDVKNSSRDSTMPNRVLIGSPNDNILELCLSRIKKKPYSRRTNLLVDIVLSASRAFFFGNKQNHEGFEESRVKAFTKAALYWAQDTFGEKIVSAVLHLDEITPHIHLLVQPLLEEGRLNMKSILPKRDSLTELHSSYACALAQLGIGRARKGGLKTGGETNVEYYPYVNQAFSPILYPDFSEYVLPTLPPIPAQGARKVIKNYCVNSIEFLLEQILTDIRKKWEEVFFSISRLLKTNQFLLDLGYVMAEEKAENLKSALKIRTYTIQKLLSELFLIPLKEDPEERQVFQTEKMVIQSRRREWEVLKPKLEPSFSDSVNPISASPRPKPHLTEPEKKPQKTTPESCVTQSAFASTHQGRDAISLLMFYKGYEDESEAVRNLAKFATPNSTLTTYTRFKVLQAPGEVQKILQGEFLPEIMDGHSFEIELPNLSRITQISPEKLLELSSLGLVGADKCGNLILCGQRLQNPKQFSYFRVGCPREPSFFRSIFR